MNVWHLDDVLVDLDTQRVQHGENSVRLSPRANAVLRALIACGDRPLSRESALDQVWANVATGDEVLSKAINELRQALGDTDARARRFIETIPKSGYRLVCSIVRVVGEPETPDTAHTEPAQADAALISIPEAPSPVDAMPSRRRWPAIAIAIGLALLMVVLGIRQDTPEPAAEQYSAAALRAGLRNAPRLLADADAYLGYADVTPDGRRALYATLIEAQVRLVTRPVGGGVAERLSRDAGGNEFAPAISHDGHLVAYLSFSGSNCRIRLHRLDNGEERDLGACSLRFAEWMEFTPQNDALLVPRMRPGDAAMSLHRIDLGDGHAMALEYPRDPHRDDVQARHSPDGHWLAVRRGPQPHSSLWLIDLRAGTGFELIDDTFGLDGFAWLPDSAGLLVGRAFGPDAGLWRIAAIDGRRDYLGLRGATRPVVARGDGTLLFTQGPRCFGLTRVQLDGQVESDPPQPWAAAQGNDWFPRWSYDETQLAFLSDRDGQVAVYIVSVESALPQRLPDIPDAVAGSTPAFSADGQRVLVVARHTDGSSSLYETAISHPAWSRLGQRRDIDEVAVSPDNHWIYYVAREGGQRMLWRRSRETGTEQSIASGLARGPIAIDSSGGVFFIVAERMALMRYSDAGGRSEKWLDDMGYWNAYAWTIAGDHVYVLLEPGGDDFGLYRAAPGQTPQLIEPMDGVLSLGLALAATRKQLLLARPPRGGLQLMQARLGAANP